MRFFLLPCGGIGVDSDTIWNEMHTYIAARTVSNDVLYIVVPPPITPPHPDFPKLAEKLSVIRTDRHEDLVRPKNILSVRKKSPKKFTVICIMFSLAFLECFTLVLAIGHQISPLVFIEVKVIQFLVFSVVQNCICYVFYSVCLEFCCFDDLVL
jgi:hypothetical protein